MGRGLEHSASNSAFGQARGNSPQRQEVRFFIRAGEQHEPGVLRLPSSRARSASTACTESLRMCSTSIPRPEVFQR